MLKVYDYVHTNMLGYSGCFQGELQLASFLLELHVYIQVYVYTWKVHAFMCVYVCYYIIHNITAENWLLSAYS